MSFGLVNLYICAVSVIAVSNMFAASTKSTHRIKTLTFYYSSFNLYKLLIGLLLYKLTLSLL